MMAAAKSSAPAAGAPGKIKKKKKSRLGYYIGIPLGLITLLVIYGMMPITGTMKYGICKTFIETHATYPQYIQIISLLERLHDARIEYTVINEFGDTIFSTITCVYRDDPTGALALSDIIINRRRVDQAEIDSFNLGIPALMANPPDLAVPPLATTDLMSLWRD